MAAGKPGTRAKITPAGLALIMDRALKHPRIQRTKLAEELQAELKAMGRDIPEIEVLERKISWFRNHETDDPQDKPWSTATLDQYPIPPEALPSVLQAWVYVREHLNISFTVRQAKRVARLYSVIKDIPHLVSEALCYAQIELIADIIPGSKIETAGADLALFESMTGEKLSIERRGQILGLDRELTEKILSIQSLESIDHEPRRRQEMRPEEAKNLGDRDWAKHFGDRDWYEKFLEAYSLIMREVKSEEDWLKRIPKLKKLFNELGLEVPEKYKEANHERSHSQEGQE